MPAALVALLGVALAAVAALGRPRVAFTTIVATTVLLPDTLALPTSVSPVLTIHLVVTVAALGGLAWRTAEGLTPPSVWRPSGASLGLLAYLAVALTVGIAAAAPGVPVGASLLRAVDLVQQLLVLIACIALVREDGRPMAFAAPVAGVLLVSAGIGLVEHATGASWGHFLFSRLPSQASTPAATPLQLRGGEVRVRAGADFALSYAAVLVAMLSLLVVAAVRSPGVRRLLWLAGGVVVLLAIYWSGTRSVLAAFVVVLVVLALLSGQARVAIPAAVVVVVAVVAVGVVAAVGQHFSVGVDAGSIAVRQQRLPVILQAVAARPFTGLGLSGLSTVGVSAVDSSYLLVYGETGVLGLAALLAALVAAFCSVGRGLWSRDRPHRLLVAAVLAGMLSIVVSAVALDAIDLPSVIDVLWELAAVGVVAADRALRPARLLRRGVVLVSGTAAAAVIGAAAAVAAPVHVAQTYLFGTLADITDVGTGDLSLTGDALIATACQALQAEAQRLPQPVDVSCRNLYRANGEGELRLQASTQRALQAALPDLGRVVRRAGLRFFTAAPTGVATSGRPSGLLTLPASAALAVLIMLVAVPLNRRELPARPRAGPRPAPSPRRSSSRTAPSRTPALAPGPPT